METIKVQEDGETIVRFVLSAIIDPDGEAAVKWRDKFSLIPKSTVNALKDMGTIHSWEFRCKHR